MTRQLKLRVAAATSGLLASGLALADPTGVDVTSVTATIAAQLTPIGLIGAAVLGIVVAVKAYKWVRSAM